MARFIQKRASVFAYGLLMAAAATAANAANSATQPSGPGAPAPSASNGNDLTDLSIEQLLNVQVITPAGLTATEARAVPVDITELDAKDIQESGARDLNHLLEIYVPNGQVIDHNTPGNNFGIRGIISDREDKYLYQVNGVTLNNRMLYGANDERDLPLLGDIKTVSVVEGPASATYGSGALAGAIAVQTYNGLTFQGLDFSARQGVVDQYTATEVRYGKQFSETSGIFLYYGFADVQGAAAPYYIGASHAAANGLPANVAGDPYSGPKQNLGAPAFSDPWHKFHFSYVDGPFEIWTRYTQDGTDTQPRRDIYTKVIPASDSLQTWTDGRPIANQQFTTAATFKKDLTPDLKLALLQSYDFWLTKDQREGVTVGVPTRDSYEDQLFSQAIATWTPSKSDTLAVGTEYSHIWYHDPAQSDALDLTPVVMQRYWESDTVSFLAENQWRINKEWTAFLSIRTDKNTFTSWLVSPRATLVYEPTPVDTFKAIAGQAVRRADDEDLWGVWERTSKYGKPETLQNYEVAYERKLTDQLSLNLDSFYEHYRAIGWNPSQLMDTSLGIYNIAGGDFQLAYKTQSTRAMLSEGVSKLVHASVPDGSPAASEGISSAPYGFGNDLANWAPSITKFSIEQDIGRQFTASGSVVYYSGFPGAEDYASYVRSLPSPPSGVPLSDRGYNTPYGPNLYVNMGLEFRPSDHWTIRLDGYDLAALANPKLSKRNEILRASEFSVQPAAAAISVRYSF